MIPLPWEFLALYVYAALCTGWSIYRFSQRGGYAKFISVVAGALWFVALPLHLWSVEDDRPSSRRRVRS